MSEVNSNIEIAHTISEHGHSQAPSDRRAEWIEIFEGFVLAVVALATAWSGFQAARWDGRSAERYAQAMRATVLAQEKATLAGQDRLYDITTFNGWMEAKALGNEKMAALYERRFRPEHGAAITAWQKLDPLRTSSAPAGGVFMPEYSNSNARESAALFKEAKASFDTGRSARETGDQYVKVTVLLATVLMLTALGQRFKTFRPRVAMVVIATILLGTSSYYVLMLPRIW